MGLLLLNLLFVCFSGGLGLYWLRCCLYFCGLMVCVWFDIACGGGAVVLFPVVFAMWFVVCVCLRCVNCLTDLLLVNSVAVYLV